MKITVLHGQNHKGSTWNITKLLLDELVTETDTVLEFNTNDLNSCSGCFICIFKDEALCPHRSIVGPMIEAVEQADIVIIESPNYCMGMSGQLKIFFDHMAYRWMSHRPHAAMKQKIGVAISTTAGVGARKVTKDITQQMFWWGIGKTYRVPFVVAAKNWIEVTDDKKDRITNRIRKCSQSIKKSIGKVKPALKSQFIFGMMKVQQKKNSWNPVDRKHWEDMGWLG